MSQICMPTIECRTRSRFARPCAAFFFASMCSFSARAAAGPVIDCIVQCGSQSCTVMDGGHPPSTPISRGERRQVRDCLPAYMSGDAATLYGVYQGSQGLVRFTVNKPDKPFREQVKDLASAKCSIGGSCLEERESRRVSQIGGMGADETKVAHEGEPCVMGLPCGVILKPAIALSFEIAGVRAGELTLSAKRGAERSQAVYNIDNGRVKIPAAALAAGGVYKYTLKGGGTPATVGEFSVMSSRMQTDVEESIAESNRKEPERAGLAEIEILVEENLIWDANQRTR